MADRAVAGPIRTFPFEQSMPFGIIGTQSAMPRIVHLDEAAAKRLAIGHPPGNRGLTPTILPRLRQKSRASAHGFGAVVPTETWAANGAASIDSAGNRGYHAVVYPGRG